MGGTPNNSHARERSGTAAAQAHRELMARKSRQATALVADIGEIPAVADPERRRSCRLDLARFLTVYFPHSTGLSPFSADHLRAIGRLQSAVLAGGRFAEAMPRGFAKTTIAENAVLWAALYGHRRFPVLFGADANAANSNIASIKAELESNDLLAADFPEVCAPIAALEGKVQRCRSQTHAPGALEGWPGQREASARTHIEWTADTIVLPVVLLPEGWDAPGGPAPDAKLVPTPASGVIITTRGITAGVRGLKHKRYDGIQQRPDFVILDDPQTDESAGTALQVEKRLKIVRGSILRLGAHGQPITAFLAGTVIRPDDLVDQLLDHARNPSWQSERIPLISKWAERHRELWLGEYARLRNDYNPSVVDDQQRAHRAATEFYAAHRAEMDAGAVVTWEWCFDRDTELSALQHAANILIDDGEEVFAAECQNEPLRAVDQRSDFSPLTAREIAQRVNGLPAGTAPLAVQHVVAFIDVGASLLWWAVMGFAENFTGAVLAYGSWPEQGEPYFAARDARRTLADATGAASTEGAIAGGLAQLGDHLLARDWRREDGATLRVERCLVDRGFKPDPVCAFARTSAHAAVLLPSVGEGIGPNRIPIDEYTRRKGERIGDQWYIRRDPKRAVRHVLLDANHWKTFVHERLRTAPGDPGSMTLYGRPREADHRLLADHLTAETCVRTEGRGRVVYVWTIRPGGPDNHLLDCVVGCCVAASMLGCTLAGAGPAVKRTARRVSFSQQQRSARGAA